MALIYRNTRTSCLSLAHLCSWVSHDTLNRLLHAESPWSGRLWELLASRLVNAGGYLVLDDTTWERWARHSEAVSWAWPSTAGRITQGMQVVLLIWTGGYWKVPLCDQRSVDQAGAGQEALPTAPADRRDDSFVEAGVWLGRIKCAHGESARGTSALGIDGTVFSPTRGLHSQAECLCAQARVISPADS